MAILTAVRRKSSGRRFITSLRGNSPFVHFDEFPRARFNPVATLLPISERRYASNVNVEGKKRTRCTFNKEIRRKVAGIRRKTTRKYPREYNTTAAVLW